jgi:beta-lactam-binding protein with PASTA domain
VVPTLKGLTEGAAKQRLAKYGLALGPVVESDSGSAPVVVAQNPAANDSAFVNDVVSVTMATKGVALLPVQQGTPKKPTTTSTKTIAEVPPPPPATVPLISVPQVTNISFELARSLIDRKGLTTVSTTTDTGRTFIVKSQLPTA